MGEAKRKEQQALLKKKNAGVPIRLLKAATAVIVMVPMLFVYAAVQCYRTNEWLWQDMGITK